MEEEWRKIEGYDNYSVSNYGEVRNDKTKIILKLYLNIEGYYRIRLYKKKERKGELVHRLVAKAFIPNLDNLPEVHHIDINTSNNYFNNLKWVTRLENGQSINRKCNIGCISSYIKKGHTYYIAKVKVYGKRHQKNSKDREICEEWLKNRRYEIENELEITKDKKY